MYCLRLLQVIMRRHKGIGMNKPQKSKTEAVVTLKVRLLPAVLGFLYPDRNDTSDFYQIEF